MNMKCSQSQFHIMCVCACVFTYVCTPCMCMHTYFCMHFVVVLRDNVLALVRLVFTTLSDAMEDNPANRRHFDNNVSNSL